MNPDVMQLQQSIKQQSEDLRDELADLASWEATIRKKNAESKAKGSAGAASIGESLPPIRGTAPLVAPAPAKPKDDPAAACKEQGNEYFRRCQFDDALRMYSKGIAYDPDNSAMHVMYANRAMCHLKLGNNAAAETDATKAIQMNRAYSKAFFRRGVARKNLGKLADARADLEMVLVLSPGDKDSEQELRAVAELARRQPPQPAAASGASNGSGGSAAAPAPARKKLTIVEVDDDADADADADAAESAEVMAERASRHATDAAAHRAAAEQAERDRAKRAAAEEAERSRARRTNTRVEEIADDDDEPEVAMPRRARPTPTAAPAAAPVASEPVRPREVAPVRPTKASLVAPRSAADFEKTCPSLRSDPALLAHFVGLVPAERLPAVLGSAATSEVAADVLRAVAAMDATAGRAYVEALSKVRRVSELAMMFDDAEKAALDAALAHVAAPADVRARFA